MFGKGSLLLVVILIALGLVSSARINMKNVHPTNKHMKAGQKHEFIHRCCTRTNPMQSWVYFPPFASCDAPNFEC